MSGPWRGHVQPCNPSAYSPAPPFKFRPGPLLFTLTLLLSIPVCNPASGPFSSTNSGCKQLVSWEDPMYTCCSLCPVFGSVFWINFGLCSSVSSPFKLLHEASSLHLVWHCHQTLSLVPGSACHAQNLWHCASSMRALPALGSPLPQLPALTVPQQEAGAYHLQKQI